MILMLLRLRRGYDSISLSKMFGISDTLVSRIFATWTSLLIRGELALKGATLNIPPFTMGKQMCSAATTKTRRIAHARIHVERAIGRLKNFAILQGTLPLRMKSQLDNVVKVCTILCNLENNLLNESLQLNVPFYCFLRILLYDTR